MRTIYSLILLIFSPPLLSLAQTLPLGFSRESLDNQLISPTVMAFAPDGRLFICEQQGRIKIFKNGAMLPTAFAQLATDDTGERGLLGIDFDPDFANNGYVYVYYTRDFTPHRNQVSRLTRDPTNPDVMLAGSETWVLEFDALTSATNHNGGFIQFGTDGKLYVAIGENAEYTQSQVYHNYLGKLIRINADGSAPTDNPFYNSTPDGSSPTAASQRIWALGLRNPYSFDIDFGTGKIFVNDVGGNQYEEVNDATLAGQNFGWITQEGPPKPGFDGPAYYYGNSRAFGNTDSTGCSVLGGEFFVPAATNYPTIYAGKYFFMDYCAGWIRYIDPANTPANGSKLFGQDFGSGLVNLTTGPDGNLYYLHRNGSLNRIVYTPLIESVASGAWNNAATWSCACVPNKYDRVSIKTGHNVSVDGITALAREVLMNGGDVEVSNNGKIQLNQ